jgi:hypothetical protein
VTRNGSAVEGVQDLLGAGADAKVFGEIGPEDFAGGVDEEFGGAGNVGAVFATVGVDQVPAADDVVLGVGKNGEGVAGRLPEMLGLLRRIHTNGDYANLARVEIGQALLETPQLGVAERSPVAAIEDQHDGGGFAGGGARRAIRDERGLQEMRKRYVFALRIGQREIRCKLADLRSAVGRGKPLCQTENPKEKEPDERNAENAQDASEDLSAVGVRTAKGAQNAAGHEIQRQSHEEQSGPGKVTRDGVTCEKGGIADQGG